jgi:uncharacterized surface protein with fasciclin (FAS1) repeats
MNVKTLSRFGSIGALAGALVFGACSDDEKTIFQTLQGDARFSTLVTAIETAGLDDELSGPGPFTLFAPTNAAFDALPAGVLDGLLADPDALADVLLYHVTSGRVLSTDLSNGQVVNTLLTGETLTITITGATVEVNAATVTQADLLASNGAIHVIDAVLVP